MPLIKSSSPQSTRVTTFSIADVEAQARAMLADARRRAGDVLTGARQEAEAIREEAYARGHAEGVAAGSADARAVGERMGREEASREYRERLDGLAVTWASVIDEIDGRRRAMIDDARGDMVRLAVAIARRVVRRVGESDPEALGVCVRAAIGLTANRSRLVVAVHPSQTQAMREHLTSMSSVSSGNDSVRIVEDTSVIPGGCRVRTPDGGLIDADLDAQIDRIAAALMPPAPERRRDARASDAHADADFLSRTGRTGDEVTHESGDEGAAA